MMTLLRYPIWGKAFESGVAFNASFLHLSADLEED